MVVTGTGSAEGRLVSRVRPLIEPALAVLTVGALAAGGIAWLGGWRDVADGCWIAGTVLAGCRRCCGCWQRCAGDGSGWTSSPVLSLWARCWSASTWLAR